MDERLRRTTEVLYMRLSSHGIVSHSSVTSEITPLHVLSPKRSVPRNVEFQAHVIKYLVLNLLSNCDSHISERANKY